MICCICTSFLIFIPVLIKNSSWFIAKKYYCTSEKESTVYKWAPVADDLILVLLSLPPRQPNTYMCHIVSKFSQQHYRLCWYECVLVHKSQTRVRTVMRYKNISCAWSLSYSTTESFKHFSSNFRGDTPILFPWIESIWHIWKCGIHKKVWKCSVTFMLLF